MGTIRWFIEDIGTVLIDPRSLIAVVRVEKRGIGEALIFVVLFSMATVLALSTPIVVLISMFIPFRIGLAAYGVAAAIGVLGGVVLWALDSILIHAISRILGGQGTISETAVAVGYSYAATWPIPLMGLIANVTDWFAGMFLIMLGTAIEIVWRWYVLAQSLSEVHGYSALRGVAALIITRLIYVVLLILFFISVTIAFSTGLRWTA